MDLMSQRPSYGRINYTEEISKLEELILSGKANIDQLNVDNAKEKEKLVATISEISEDKEATLRKIKELNATKFTLGKTT